jgi:hypothetical protein
VSWLRQAALAFSLLGLAACGDLAQPFAHTPEDLTRARMSVLELPDRGGIAIAPEIGGAPAQVSEALVKAMIKAFAAANVAATTAGRTKYSYILEGRMTAAPVGGQSKVLILWLLTDPKGNKVGEHFQHETASARDWERASAALMAQIAERGAPAIAAFIQEKDVTPRQTALTSPVVVMPVEGAPGDGNTSLTRAMRHFLKGSKVNVVDQTAGAAGMIQGVVNVGPPRGGSQPVQIVWKVLKPDGTEVGRAEQGNFVPTGTLDGAWSDFAFLIAEAATPGVTEILARLPAPAKPAGTP